MQVRIPAQAVSFSCVLLLVCFYKTCSVTLARASSPCLGSFFAFGAGQDICHCFQDVLQQFQRLFVRLQYHREIGFAARSGGSGTTQQFTLFLTNAATSSWKLKSASTIEWPADTQAGNGNGGVAQIVKSTKGAIGYVDLPDVKASGLKFASVKNAGGKFIEPSSASAQAAGEGVEVKDDLTFVAVNAKGDATYPITAPSWCVVYTKPADKAKGAALKRYFTFMVTDAQKMARPT